MAKKLAKKADLSQAKAAEVVDIIFSADPGEGIIAVELDADGNDAMPGRIAKDVGAMAGTGEFIRFPQWHGQCVPALHP